MTILPELATADACPICRIDHMQIDEYQRCPHQGHRLEYGGHDDDGYRYYCPAIYTIGCRYERHFREPLARKEPPPMTVTIHQPTSDIAIRDGQEFWDKKQLAALRQLGVDNAPHAELAVFFHRCQSTGLDPFARQICMIKRREKRPSGYVDKWTIQIEIDGYRLIGHRAARRDGKTIAKPGPVWYDADGNTYPAWFKPGPPAAAKVTILVDGQPFEGVASYAEFAQLKSDGTPTAMWAKMGANQTAKCAEAQAWRAAFPADFRLQGVEFTADPMPTAEPAAAAETWHAAAQPVEDYTEHGKAQEAVRNAFNALGVYDEDEQLNLTVALLGQDTILDDLAAVPLPDLQRIKAQLSRCEDVGQVHALIDRGDAPGGDAA